MTYLERDSRLRHTVRLLKADGLVGGRKLDFQEFLNLPHDQAGSFLRVRLKNLISGLVILEHDGPYEMFNRHDLTHLDHASSIAHELLDECQKQRQIEVTPLERNLTTAIAYLHDVGNNIDRRNHGELSAYLFSRIFGNFDSADIAVKTILTGIRLHDEPLGVKFNGMEEMGSAGEYIDVLPLPILAVVAADKLDVGRHRLSTALAGRVQTPFEHIIEETPHTLVIIYVQNNQLYFIKDGRKLAWQIDFSTDVSGEKDPYLRKILEWFIWKEHDIYVPREWHADWKKKDIPYSVSYFGNMRSLYCTRLALMLSSLYALLPRLETVEISVVDSKSYIGTRLVSEYPKDQWRDILFMVWKKLNRDNYRLRIVSPPNILKLGEKHYEERKGYTV